MSVRKRDDWLDIEGDQDSDVADNSDVQGDSRGALLGRTAKRRRLSNESGSGSGSGSEHFTEDEASDDDRFVTALDQGFDDDEELPNDITASVTPKSAKTKESHVKPLSIKQLEASEKAIKKTGVIYLSRIPPFMKPMALKNYFQAYGAINRVFLTPEDASAHTRRVRKGGNKKTLYLDGWVEFLSKKDAKMVADALNGNILGGKKGGYYHDDVWNIKYLKGFKWNHLTEQIANENAERAARLRAEIARTRKENRAFVRDVEQGKILDTKAAKKAARKGDGKVEQQVPTRSFKQNLVKTDLRTKDKDKARQAQPEATERVLGKLL